MGKRTKRIPLLAILICFTLPLQLSAKPLTAFTDKEVTWLTAHPRIKIGVMDAIASPKEQPELAAILDKALKAIPASQKQSIINRYVNLSEKTAHPQASDRTITPKRLGILSIIFLSVILLILLILSKGMRQERVAALFGSPWFRTLIVSGLCLFVLTISGLGWLMMEKTRKSTIRDVASHLRLMLGLTQDRADMWTTDKIAAISHLCTHPPLTDITRRLLSDYHAKKQMITSPYQAEAMAGFYEIRMAGFIILGVTLVLSVLSVLLVLVLGDRTRKTLEAAKTDLEKMKTYAWPDQYRAGIDQLTTMIGKYKFKDSGVILSELIAKFES